MKELSGKWQIKESLGNYKKIITVTDLNCNVIITLSFNQKLQSENFVAKTNSKPLM